MKVIGALGRYVGFVRHVEGQQLVIGRPAAADIRVPASAWRIDSEDRVVLSVAADEVDRMGWTPTNIPDEWNSLADF